MCWWGGASYRRGWVLDRAPVRDLGWRMPARAAGRVPGGRRCRCSTSITRCGSGPSWVISTIPSSPVAAQLAYWRDALVGMPERVVLPTDRPYPVVADYRGATVAVEGPLSCSSGSRRWLGEHKATSFMVVQAALAVLHWQVGGTSDVAVGFPIAGRSDPALEMIWSGFRQHPGVAGGSGR